MSAFVESFSDEVDDLALPFGELVATAAPLGGPVLAEKTK